MSNDFKKLNFVPHPFCTGLIVAEHLDRILNKSNMEEGDRIEVHVAGIPEECQSGCEIMQKIIGFYRENGIKVDFIKREEMEREVLKRATAQMKRETIGKLLAQIGILPHDPLDSGEEAQSFQKFIRKI